MRRPTSPSAPRRSRDGRAPWRERSAHLYEELHPPSRAMIRRAFQNAFSDEEIEDIYGNAWVGTLRALERRHCELSDEEIRSYLLTAVAHQASKELRRRRRRPTASLDHAAAIAAPDASPHERATGNESSQIARDVLTTLPPRRRAVMLLRYGWGLDPAEVCSMIEGLSHRAYRKEITRGVDEVAEKLRMVDSGEWCGDREPVLKAYAAGLADVEQQRQAEHHLSHCRHCSDFVGKLTGHLHDLGSSLAVPGAVDLAEDGRFSLLERVVSVADRVRESASSMLGRGGSSAEVATPVTASGGVRGSGAAGAGVIAKVAGLGTAGKVAVACLGGGAAATVCVATGVVPSIEGSGERARASIENRSGREGRPDKLAAARILPSQLGEESPAPDRPPSAPDGENPSAPQPAPAPEPVPEPAPEPEPVPPPPPPEVQQFGVAPPPASSDSTTTSASSGGDSGSPGNGDEAAMEFGP